MAKTRRPNDSTLARLSLAKDNEDLVIAENALFGERLVSVVRIAVILLVFASMVLAGQLYGRSGVRDPMRGLTSLTYLVIAIGHYVVLRRQVPNARKAMWIPIATMLVDYAFFTFQGWRTGMLSPAAYAPQSSAAIYSLLICFTVARFSSVHVFIATFLSCGAYMTLAMTFAPHEARQHYFVLAILSAFGILIGMTQGRVRTMFLDLRRRDILTRFLPKQVAERVMSLGDTSLAPVQREVTVLFSDIRDFTSMSEQMPPNEVLKFLDEYFGHMTQLVKAHEGIVNKFLGDGMLAVWGVPERLERHAELALRAALDMRKVVEELNQVRVSRGEPAFKVGIGLHTGVVAAGMLGGTEQHEYTVIGDAVNLTSRIEGLTKTYGVDILVSQSTWELVGDRFVGEKIGECQVKGRAVPVVVYRLDSLRSAATMTAQGASPTVVVSARA